MTRAARSEPASRPGTGASPANARLLARFDEHLAARPARTREAYRRDVAVLAALAGERPLASLTRPELARHLATLHGRGLSGRSLARMLSAWRALYRHLLDAGRGLEEDPTAGLKPPKSARRLPSALSPEEAARLVEIRDDDPLAARDRAILELAYSSGLRLSELAGLDVARVDLDAGEARVLGKGAKERIVPVGRAALDAIRAWLTVRATIARAGEAALFVGRAGARLAPRSIEQRLAAWAVKQGLDRHVHPHMLRHSFASHVLQSSGDLRAVQEMLGHASIASTQVYTHLDFQALAKVYDAAHPRAKRRGAK
ncbi:MAG: tyrosine recombinase XerC [Burkholderiales bacterium]